MSWKQSNGTKKQNNYSSLVNGHNSTSCNMDTKYFVRFQKEMDPQVHESVKNLSLRYEQKVLLI